MLSIRCQRIFDESFLGAGSHERISHQSEQRAGRQPDQGRRVPVRTYIGTRLADPTTKMAMTDWYGELTCLLLLSTYQCRCRCRNDRPRWPGAAGADCCLLPCRTTNSNGPTSQYIPKQTLFGAWPMMLAVQQQMDPCPFGKHRPGTVI